MNRFLAFFLLFAGVASAAPPAREIMQRNETARKIRDVTSSATLTTGGGGSPERVKKFSWSRKLLADGVHFDTLTRFHEPAEVRGEGILFLERDNDENDVMMYLPAFKKIRRVESQQQSGSFMGSEFSYADIATPHLDDYAYKLEREEKCPGDAAATCYVVESTPARDDVRERTGYSRTVSWIRADNFMAVRGEYYKAEGGELGKTMDASEIREVDTKEHRWMSHRLRIENAASHRYTLLQFAEVKVNAGVPDSTFTQANLSKER
jgi:outer membrane lipoprotein-sorting protein